MRVPALQRGFQRIFTKDIRDQIGPALLGLQLGAIDAKVAGRNFRIQNLFDANNDIHDGTAIVSEGGWRGSERNVGTAAEPGDSLCVTGTLAATA